MPAAWIVFFDSSMKGLPLLAVTLSIVFVSCKQNNIKNTDNVPEGYQLVWSDEFNVDGRLDDQMWKYELGYVRNHEPQSYEQSNAVCKNGKLVIEARIEDDGKLTSASIISKKSFIYGRIEASMKIPMGPSAWPAFWMLGSTRPWPDGGEIDIMEFYRYGENLIPSLLANTFWTAENGIDVIDDTGTVPVSEVAAGNPEWAEQFHVWRMDWDENWIKLYVDDTLVNSTDLSGTLNRGGDHVGENPFHLPQEIKLNLALRGRENDPVVEFAFPMQFEIDYVRVYERL